MKQKINIILGFFLFSICIYGQEKPVYTIASLHTLESRAITSSANMDRPVPFSYKLTPEWKTHKKYRAYGWTTLGVGSLMLISGFLGYAIDNMDGPAIQYRFLPLGITGAAITSSSIPFFVLSAKNKKKARSISLGCKTLAAPLGRAGMAYTPGMSVGISF